MHTSTRLQAADFQFWQSYQGQRTAIRFADFWPNYHELDRIGVVSPSLEDGILHTAYALLALTTAFYDAQRAHTSNFFDYPQHFALVGADDHDVYTGGHPIPRTRPALWEAWSWLDVWPENKWITGSPTASGMLKQIFNYQINRIFWPSDLKPAATENPLPGYAYKMLKTSLKTVHYYEHTNMFADPSAVMLEIQANASVTTLGQESVAQLPNAQVLALPQPTLTFERYQAVKISDFLDEMQSCFTGL